MNLKIKLIENGLMPLKKLKVLLVMIVMHLKVKLLDHFKQRLFHWVFNVNLKKVIIWKYGADQEMR